MMRAHQGELYAADSQGQERLSERTANKTKTIKCNIKTDYVEGEMKIDTRNEIKSYIVREGMTMAALVEKLADQYGWSASVPNLSGKLRRDSLRYREAIELADVLGYDIVWQKRGKGQRH